MVDIKEQNPEIEGDEQEFSEKEFLSGIAEI